MKNKPLATFSSIVPDLKDYLRGKMRGYKSTINEAPIDLKTLDPKTEILGCFVDSHVDKSVFDKLKKLKMIATFSTGYDHIDLKEAKRRGIPVCNVPTYGENTVAQHAMALMLALSRKLFQSVKRVKEGVYDYHGLRGFDLKGKTIGVIGTGHIGIHLIDMLDGFEANVVAYDAFPNKDLEKDHAFTYVSLDKLLKESDIISLHVPLFPTTYHMINDKALNKMKDGVHIINTARGGLIDPEAMVYALENGKVGGLAVDVLEEENYIAHPEKIDKKTTPEEIRASLMENIIIDHPNTIITPHNAFNSTEALKRIFDTSVENIKAFSAGEIQNDVTKPKKKK
ncbi:hydroxyacid dehydrogenase [Candidatus Parcubacteria bacterium]|nr:MAG: hydroxyacid dehydrogenase [Candidatus Parcubacteria bacterium]